MAAIVVRRPSSIVHDCSGILLTVEIRLLVRDGGGDFFWNGIEIRLRGIMWMGKRGLG